MRKYRVAIGAALLELVALSSLGAETRAADPTLESGNTSTATKCADAVRAAERLLLCGWNDDVLEARNLLDSAVSSWRVHQDPVESCGRALHLLASLSDAASERALLEEAVDLLREAGSLAPLGRALADLAALESRSGRSGEARVLEQESLESLARGLGANSPEVLAARAMYAAALAQAGATTVDLATAEADLDEIARLSLTHVDPNSRAAILILSARADFFEATHRPSEAKSLRQEASDRSRSLRESAAQAGQDERDCRRPPATPVR